ncbi:ulp1 protease family, C-terminal catalytic domain-containing protein, partial [Tanacetum coccineum]
MEGNDDGQDSDKNKLRFKVKMIDSGRTLKINEMLRKKNAEIEAKRIAEEEEAAKDKEEEEETEDDENVEKEVEKNVVELANEVATKSVEELFAILESKKKPAEQPRKKTDKEAKEKEAKKGKHVEETKYDVDNMEKDVEDEEANLVEEQESEQADNEEDSEENDDVNQIFNNIQTMPFLNTATRSNKNQVGKGLTKTVVDEAKKKNKEEQIEKKRRNLEHHKDFDPDEDQNGIDLYKGLDVYIEPLSERKPVTKEEFYEKIIKKFTKISEERSELIETLKEGMTKFREVVFSMEVDETENEKEKQTENVKEQQAEKEKEKQAENEEKQDDIRKGTEEAGSETKNDGEEVHAKVDDPNEQMKDKEADKQKVNDGNENEKDKQDEFRNKEYDLTESECEELEYQATQDIKKKKTTKRKSPEDMTPPTFSLGLTPEESEPTEKEKEKQVEKRAKGKATTDEVMVTQYLFSMEGEELDFVFETKDGAATIRDYMQTLAPQLKVEYNVIDTFSLILNHEHKMNSKGKRTKYFFHTTMITKEMFKWKKANGKYDEKKQFEAFSKTIKSEFEKDPEMKNMKDLEMAFFPIIAHEHYYLVVFNFLKGNTVIIDNSRTQMTYETKYKTVCELL